MPRLMSFSMTTQQVRDRTKDVTRRLGWCFLKPGDRLWGVEKAMGLRKGETAQRIAMIEVVSTRPERLNEITAEDVEREGFPEFTPADFVRFLSQKTGCTADVIINRIEFRYVEEGAADG